MPRIVIKLSIPCSLALIAGSLAASPSPELSAEDLQFFENRIRPILSEECYKCHAEDSKKIKGGLLLDRRAGWVQGGDSGEVIVPGDPDASMLIKMVEHDPDFDAMPPKSKLKPEQIEDLRNWVQRGAPDPRGEGIGEVAVSDEFDLEERKTWWSLQPLTDPEVPSTQDKDWPLNSYDHFVLEQLELKGWSPAIPARREQLLRRASLALTGLAPTEEELARFLADDAPDAYERNVDRLLASPHFGERWARHWQDSARFAETKAFEQDYTIPQLSRYRDYLIRAFNEDVSYDRFVKEHLAGDLLATPRISPMSGLNESLAGPGFLYLTDGQHGPPDLHADEARVFDSIIAATSITFQGLTLACAKCHDHKFDAITAKDYYSFYGLLRSSRLHYANLVDPAALERSSTQLRSAKSELLKLTFAHVETEALQLDGIVGALLEIRSTPDYPAWRDALRAPLKNDEQSGARIAAFNKSSRSLVQSVANAHQIDSNLLSRWLLWSSKDEPAQELRVLHALINEQPLDILRKKAQPLPPTNTGHDFGLSPTSLGTWIPSGTGFLPTAGDGFIPSPRGNQVFRTAIASGATTGTLSGRINGVLRSPDFILDGNPVELWAKGRQSTIKLIVRNYEMAGQGPTTARLKVELDSDAWTRVRFDTKLWPGEPAYLEVQHHGPVMNVVAAGTSPPAPSDLAYVALSPGRLPAWGSVWLSGNATAPPAPETIPTIIRELAARASAGTLTPPETEVLGALFASQLLPLDLAGDSSLQDALRNYRNLADEVPSPVYARSIVDGQDHDEPVYLRGDHRRISEEPNPKRFLDGFGGAELTSPGSGRLDWASHVATPENPLTSRVRVNRIWARLFGQGIVPSVDDFGKMGEHPSHPELLDHIARDFISHRWSTKHILRKMVLSQTFRMSSTPSPEAAVEDPKNTFLQHMPVQRMDGESIRDHILACSGELKREVHGPSIPIYVDDQPDSRAKPRYKAPLDGAGRRSLYLELRRNYMPAFLRIFDMPNGAESTGKRHTTNVPAQALALLNDPFVHQQSRTWAKSIMARSESATERLQIIHRQAFSREATSADIAWGFKVLEQFSSAGSDEDIWTALCHLMINRKEFIYVQ